MVLKQKDLEHIVNRGVDLVVEVLEVDAELVVSFRGEFVERFKAEPQLSWHKVSSKAYHLDISLSC